MASQTECSHESKTRRLASCGHEVCIGCLAGMLEASTNAELMCPLAGCETWLTEFDLSAVRKFAQSLLPPDSPSPSVFTKTSTPLPDAPTEERQRRSILLSELVDSPEHSLWVPDDSRTTCMKCRAEFSFWVRRHHCRYCGRLLCATCCPFVLDELPRRCLDCEDIVLLDPSQGLLRFEL